MRFLIILIIIFVGGCEAGPIISAQTKEAAELEKKFAESYRMESKLIDYYAKRPHAKLDPDFLFAVARDVRGFASELCIEGETDTILALINEESHFKSGVIGFDKKSKGLGQTLYKSTKRWRSFWLARGVKLGSFDDPTTQVAYCVAEFKEKLGYAHGNIFEACRRYNGRGKRAVRHANKVAKARKEIFGRPFKKGERVDYGDCQ